MTSCLSNVAGDFSSSAAVVRPSFVFPAMKARRTESNSEGGKEESTE
jgi:hypothetical protein